MASEVETASPSNGVTGVVIMPPGQIRGAIKAAVADALAQIPPGKKAVAEVAVDLKSGVNLVYAYKSEDGHWTAATWIGSNWSGEWHGGAQVTRTW